MVPGTASRRPRRSRCASRRGSRLVVVATASSSWRRGSAVAGRTVTSARTRRWSARSTTQRAADAGRALWIVRVNAAARLNGTTYSKLIAGMKKVGVLLDRKVLADLALFAPADFAAVVKSAQS